MWRILCVILLFVICDFSVSVAEIEIYAGGKHFNSFEDYQNHKSAPDFDQLRFQGTVVDTRKAPYISLQDRKKLEKIAYDREVDQVLADFKKQPTASESKYILDANDLQYAIRDTMGKNNGPVLLISDAGKMRLVSYNLKDKIMPPQKSQVDKNVKE